MNAELIKALRYCGKGVCCRECPMYFESSEECRKAMTDAADALEAAEQRIAELSLDCEMYQQKCMELDAQKPKEGEWFKYNNPNYSPFDDSGEYLYQCNKCGKVVVKATNYCPNCGARMRGERQ